MWYLLPWKLTLKWTKLVLFLTFSHLISKSDGLYDPDVTSESLYRSPCDYSLKNRAFFNFMNVLNLSHATQSQSGHLEDKNRDSCVVSCVGVDSKVSSQVKIGYIKLTLKMSFRRPSYHFLICQAQLLVFLLVLGDTAFL